MENEGLAARVAALAARMKAEKARIDSEMIEAAQVRNAKRLGAVLDGLGLDDLGVRVLVQPLVANSRVAKPCVFACVRVAQGRGYVPPHGTLQPFDPASRSFGSESSGLTDWLSIDGRSITDIEAAELVVAWLEAKHGK